ncbi:hypothetical protein Tco_0178523 [Tanacetum coccineum]
MGDMYRFNQDSRFKIRDSRVHFAHSSYDLMVAVMEVEEEEERSPEEESVPGNNGDEHLEDAPSKENHREGLEIEDDIGS